MEETDKKNGTKKEREKDRQTDGQQKLVEITL